MYNTIKNDVIETSLVEGIHYTTYPKFDKEPSRIIKESILKNVIYTDGDVKEVLEFVVNDLNHVPLEIKLDELNLVKNIFQVDSSISEVVLKRVVIENATYYINLNYHEKWADLANIHGFFWHLEDLQVNVVRPICKETRKRIKQTLNDINGRKLSYNASIFESLFGKNVTPQVEYQESLDKVYTLKKN